MLLTVKSRTPAKKKHYRSDRARGVGELRENIALIGVRMSDVLTKSINTATAGYTLEANGDLDSNILGGLVSFSTKVPFTGAGDAFPSVGEMLITGANNSSVRLIAVNSVTVSLQVDEDGDGAFDEVIASTWEEILAAAS